MSNVALQDVYANNLQQNRGYPLRRPNFPGSRKGLRIGDVGHVDETGAFHVLCNICSPSCSNQFQAIELDEDLICRNATSILQHSFFTGVNQDICQESGMFKFATTAESGAILILPSGAKLYDLQDRQKLDEFQDLAVKHAHRWCLSAGHNSLYLITGLCQTDSWTLGSFYGRRDVDGDKILVRTSVEEDNDPAAYKWKFEFSNLDFQSCRKDAKFENQTVLIKGFKMKVRPKLGVTVVGRVQESRNFTLLLEYLMCLALLLEYLKRLASQLGVIIPPITSIIEPYPELSRQPHYLDVVNDYLLENFDGDVVITHDDVWIKMLENSDSVAIPESELLEHVKGEYIRRSRSNAIWLQCPLEDPNGALIQETVSSESRVVITHICAENVPVGFGYVPVGCFVRVEIDDGIFRWTENKPAPVGDHNIQWNDRIYLPSASSTRVRLVLYESFEFSPVLGHGKFLGTVKTCVCELLERTIAFKFTINELMPRSSSLLVSVQQWYGNCCMSSCVDDSDQKEHSTLVDVIDLTDEGHHALLSYYRNHREEDLELSVERFTQALKKCPKDDPRHVVAMFNLAKAEFISDQFHHAHQNFHHSTSLFEEALRLRAGDHRDRPMTLLYLSQALLYYCARGLQEPQSTLHEYIKELEAICPRDTHARRAADLVLQRYELIRLQTSDDFGKLNELISKWVRVADEVPEAYFDKPVRFDNIGLAFQRRFQLCHDTADLERAVEWFEKAVQITPDGHAQKSTYTDHLSDVLYQWTTVVLTSSSVNEACDAAAKLGVPKSHVYRAICDVLEGSNRVLEAIKCFCKMQDELFEMHIPSERATWEIDFRRRYVKKFDEQGDTLMESRKPNAAIESYSIALSLDPTNISDIIVKCCKAGLLRLINVNKFRVYWTRCDDFEGSGRVLEAIACFRKMQDELVEMSVPDDRAAWELDFRRRCVEKLEKQGDTLVESRELNIAIRYYSIALSLDPTNISDIIVKYCKARAGLLEGQRPINKGSARVPYSTAPRTNDLVLYVFAVDFSLSSKFGEIAEIETIELYKYKSVAEKISKTIRAGESHREEFSRPITIEPSDNFRASVKLRKNRRSSEDVLVNLNLHEVEFTSNEKGERFYRFEAAKGIVVVVSALREFSAVTNRVMPTNSESQFRILVIGNSGVGKSLLVNKVFGIDDAQVSATARGEADIERGLTFKDKRFVIHETLGFESHDEACDEESIRIVKKFVDQRKKMMSENDRLHAVWLCLEIPYAGGRLLEAGTEKLLKERKNVLGDIPLVVVFTKVDLLDGEVLINLRKGETVEDLKSETINKRIITPLRKAGGHDLKCVTVSTGDDYADDLYELLEATSGKNQ